MPFRNPAQSGPRSKMLAIRMTQEMHDRIEAEAKKRNVWKSDVVIDYIERGLAKPGERATNVSVFG